MPTIVKAIYRHMCQMASQALHIDSIFSVIAILHSGFMSQQWLNKSSVMFQKEEHIYIYPHTHENTIEVFTAVSRHQKQGYLYCRLLPLCMV